MIKIDEASSYNLLNFAVSFCEVPLMAIIPIHVVLLHSLRFFPCASDLNTISARGRTIESSSLIYTTRRLVRTCHVCCERSLLVSLVNHAELVDDATRSANHCAFVLLEDQRVYLLAVLLAAPVLFDVYLCFG